MKSSFARITANLTMRRRAFVLPLTACFVMWAAFAEKAEAVQPDEATLRLGEPVRRTLRGGEQHSYRIPLESGQFLFAKLYQEDLDVIISVLDPRDEQIVELDNLTRGPEFLSLTTEADGPYRIHVEPFNPMANPGTYTLTIEKLQKAASDLPDRMDEIFAEWDNPRGPGCAVAIIRDGQVVFKKGYGLADLEWRLPITSSTRLNICSIGKQFTAFAIAYLEAQGRLSLDDDIRKYLPKLPDFQERITVRHLIHHTSGLREIADLVALAGGTPDSSFSREDALRLIRRQTELNFRPGEQYLYCNTGYILLAEIVENVTGQPYQAWMRERVFKPLGMENTFFYYDPAAFVGEFAPCYTLDDRGNYTADPLTPAWYVGAGNVFSTAQDMGKWLANLQTPRVGSVSLIRGLEERGKLNDGSTIDYAFGQVVGAHRGLKTHSHGGGGFSYRSFMLVFSEQRFATIVLANFVHGDPYGKALEIADVCLADDFPVRRTDERPKNRRRPVVVDASIFEEYVGTYQDESGTITRVEKRGDELYAQTEGQPKVAVFPLSESRFFLKEAELEVAFGRDDQGAVSRMVVHTEGSEVRCQRVTRQPIQRHVATDLAGDYFSDELSTAYRIVVDGDHLAAKHAGNKDIRLTYIEKDTYKGGAWFFSWVEFERNGDGDVTGFRVTGHRARNIAFTRR